MKTLSSKPGNVDSPDDDLVAQVASIDVAKNSEMACTRVPDESRPGKGATNVWSARDWTSSINESPAATTTSDRPPPASYMAAIDRLDETTGIDRHDAQTIIAEVGLSMEVFPTSAHLVSWSKISPRAVQPGAKTRPGKTRKGNPYPKASSARPPPQPDAPTPSPAHATDASSDASASRKPRSQSLGPFWSSSGTCSPTPPADTTTSTRSSTTTESGPNAANATTSANSKHSATPSHSPNSPELPAFATAYLPVSHQGHDHEVTGVIRQRPRPELSCLLTSDAPNRAIFGSWWKARNYLHSGHGQCYGLRYGWLDRE